MSCSDGKEKDVVKMRDKDCLVWSLLCGSMSSHLVRQQGEGFEEEEG